MHYRIVYSILFAAALNTQAQAADPHGGKQLTDEHCYKCHGTEVYTRADRRVKSLPGLHSQVRRCELSLGLKWFDDDINNVAGYLNETFYKFE